MLHRIRKKLKWNLPKAAAFSLLGIGTRTLTQCPEEISSAQCYKVATGESLILTQDTGPLCVKKITVFAKVILH